MDQKLAWMIILATIPVGVVGLFAEHEFRVIFAKPVRAAIFLIINGIILYAGEQFRTRKSSPGRRGDRAGREGAELVGATAGHGGTGPGPRPRTPRATGPCASRRSPPAPRPTSGWWRWATCRALIIGAAQMLALLAGISRDGVTMVTGMFRGLSREDAARFAFLLATPVILAAGALKVGDLIHYGHGIHGQILAGQHPVRRRRLRVGAVPDEVLPDPHADPVRDLLRGGRAGLQRSTSALSSRRTDPVGAGSASAGPLAAGAPGALRGPAPWRPAPPCAAGPPPG